MADREKREEELKAKLQELARDYALIDEKTKDRQREYLQTSAELAKREYDRTNGFDSDGFDPADPKNGHDPDAHGLPEVDPNKPGFERPVPAKEPQTYDDPPAPTKDENYVKSDRTFFEGEVNFQQGRYGSCQTLAAINGLIETGPKGKQMLEDLIHIESTGPGGQNFYVVKFPGRPEVRIPFDQMSDPKLANGHLGVAVLERAALITHQREGGVADPLALLTTGPKDENQRTYVVDTKGLTGDNLLLTELMSEVKEGDAIMTVGTRQPPRNSQGRADSHQFQTQATRPNGETYTVSLYHAHAYTAVPIEGDKIRIENPHDTRKPIIMTRDQFVQAFERVSVGEVPGSNFDIDPRAQGAAEQARKNGKEFYDMWEAGGAWSVGGVRLDSSQRRERGKQASEWLDVRGRAASSAAALNGQGTPAGVNIDTDPSQEPGMLQALRSAEAEGITQQAKLPVKAEGAEAVPNGNNVAAANQTEQQAQGIV